MIVDELNIEPLENSLKTLKDGFLSYKKQLNNNDKEMVDITIDMCIQRFEYTLETAIKFMKKLLIKEYNIKDSGELTMTNTFRFMQDYGFLKDWNSWNNYYKSRNRSVHEYSFEKSRDVFKLIPDFINDVEFLINKLKEKLK